MKKIISLVMVIAMIAALAFTVSADDTATAPTDGLLAHFTFDDAESGLTGNGAKATTATVTRGDTVSIEDASGVPYDAAALVLAEGGDPTITDDAVVGAGAYQFDGTQCLKVTKEDGSGLLDGVNSLTISYWAKHDNTTQWPFFATPNASDGGPKSQTYPKETYIGLLENSKLSAELYNSPVNNNARTYSVGATLFTFFPDDWHHVTVVIDTDNADTTKRVITLYIDGEEDGISSPIEIEQHTVSEILGTDYSVFLGYAPWGYNDNPAHEGEWATCTLDDMYIYGRALSADEVAALEAASAREDKTPETDAPADDNTEKAPDDNTEKAPSDDKTTDKAPAGTTAGTETAAPADEGGCGSTLGAAAAVVALTAVFGCAIVKKH